MDQLQISLFACMLFLSLCALMQCVDVQVVEIEKSIARLQNKFGLQLGMHLAPEEIHGLMDGSPEVCTGCCALCSVSAGQDYAHHGHVGMFVDAVTVASCLSSNAVMCRCFVQHWPLLVSSSVLCCCSSRLGYVCVTVASCLSSMCGML